MPGQCPHPENFPGAGPHLQTGVQLQSGDLSGQDLHSMLRVLLHPALGLLLVGSLLDSQHCLRCLPQLGCHLSAPTQAWQYDHKTALDTG